MPQKPSPRRVAADRTPKDVTPVRLPRKFADIIDGVDLTDADVGDRLELPRHDAEVLIAEGWARPDAAHPLRRSTDVVATAADTPRRHGRRR